MQKKEPVSEPSKQLRDKAEQFLQLKLKRNPEKNLEGEYLKLVHELEVHEVELEMQNQELLEAITKVGDVNHRFSELYNFAPAGYYTLSRQGLIVGLNLYGSQLLGNSQSDLIDSLFESFVSSDSKTIFNQFFDNIWNKKCNETCEISLSGDESCLVDVIIKGQRAENEDHCLISALDITELNEAKATLAQKTDELNNYFNFSLDLFCIADTDAVFRQLNKAWEITLGFSLEELEGTRFLDLVHPDDLSPTLEALVKLQSQKEVLFFENRYRCKDDSYKWLEWQSYPAGEIIYAAARDITSKKIAERALITTNEKIEKSEQRYRKAQEVGHVGSWEFDMKTNQFWGSDEGKRIYGFNPDSEHFPAEEVMGCVVERERVEQAMVDLISFNKPYDITFEILPKNSPNRKVIHSVAELVFDKTGSPNLVSGVIHDITIQNKIEIELIKAKEKAEESDRLKSAFLANMSHEIRTPLNGILGFSDLLRDPHLTGEEQTEYIDIIQKGGMRLLNTINEIIDISKIEAGLMQVNATSANIFAQITYNYTLFEKEIEKKGLAFSFKNYLPSNDFILHSDHNKIGAILTNLLKNAVKYTDTGSIEFGVEKKDGFLEFFVRDTGCGVPTDRQEAIFDRFVQADIRDIQALQGSGLGLSIARAYVHMLGGRIWLECNSHPGSTFYFTIPTAEQMIRESSRPLHPIADNKLGKVLKILIAEDDLLSRILISKLTQSYAKEILHVKTGEEAVNICQTNQDIDLILMDVKMPVMDGFEATRLIRQFNKEVIIIAQTAMNEKEGYEMAMKAGCNSYISKPIDRNEFLALMHVYFNMKDFEKVPGSV